MIVHQLLYLSNITYHTVLYECSITCILWYLTEFSWSTAFIIFLIIEKFPILPVNHTIWQHIVIVVEILTGNCLWYINYSLIVDIISIRTCDPERCRKVKFQKSTNHSFTSSTGTLIFLTEWSSYLPFSQLKNNFSKFICKKGPVAIELGKIGYILAKLGKTIIKD